MSTVAAPYGLRPINNLGAGSYNGGSVRQIPMTVNVAAAIGTGDIVLIGAASAGQPTPATATVVAGTTAGVLGVCVGVSYVDPVMKYQLFAANLPTGAVTAGYTNIMIHVCDDPLQLYSLQAAGSVARVLQGKFCALENFGLSTYGVSTTRASTPSNTGGTQAMRIVDFASTPGDAFTDLIVKFNTDVLMWGNRTVLAT